MENEKVIRVLNGLLESLYNGKYGHAEAAENATSLDLVRLFQEASQERARLIDELAPLVRARGGDPENRGTAAAALFRAWMDLKGTLTGKDDLSILQSCETGEDSAVRDYTNALEEDLPVDVRALVERQAQVIKRSHDQVKQRRDRLSSAGA